MSRVYQTKQAYVEDLKAVMSADEQFKDLTYCRAHNTNEEYLVLKDIIGHVFFFDVTGYTEVMMFRCMAQMVCGITPDNWISDHAKQIEVAKLFN